MQPNLNKIRFLTGNPELLRSATERPVRRTWDERTVEFLGTFSGNLLRESGARTFPDIVSYAFWIRRASLRRIRERDYPDVSSKIGRGIAFHIAPSNVPVNFAVSFTSSLLAGNLNVVRLSEKPFEQVELIVRALKKTFAQGFEDMEQYLILVRYGHDEEITRYLSGICDVRIIWGGNGTIERVRAARIPPRAIELTFADRHSIAVLNADAVTEETVCTLAEGFYTDTYYMDQNACSSPRIVIWLGDGVEEAKKRFWAQVERLVWEKYEFREIQAVDKLDQFCLLAAGSCNVHLESTNNLVSRVRVDALEGSLMDFKLGGGYFFEYRARELEELMPLLDKACQTISYYGLSGRRIQRFIQDCGLRGGDRVVPVGKTMELTFYWDGFDMIETMSRYVTCLDADTWEDTK